MYSMLSMNINAGAPVTQQILKYMTEQLCKHFLSDKEGTLPWKWKNEKENDTYLLNIIV